MALFRSEAKVRMNLFFLIDAIGRRDRQLIGKYMDKLRPGDTPMMIEVASMNVTHIRASHGSDDTDADLDNIFEQIVDHYAEDGDRGAAARLLGRAIYVKGGEEAVKQALKQCVSQGIGTMDIHFAMIDILSCVPDMNRQTDTKPLVEAQYSAG